MLSASFAKIPTATSGLLPKTADWISLIPARRSLRIIYWEAIIPISVITISMRCSTTTESCGSAVSHGGYISWISKREKQRTIATTVLTRIPFLTIISTPFIKRKMAVFIWALCPDSADMMRTVIRSGHWSLCLLYTSLPPSARRYYWHWKILHLPVRDVPSSSVRPDIHPE